MLQSKAVPNSELLLCRGKSTMSLDCLPGLPWSPGLWWSIRFHIRSGRICHDEFWNSLTSIAVDLVVCGCYDNTIDGVVRLHLN